ncbi:hypothetical protein AVEN_115324-1 [Araneus ventricosus]|uniref:Uncharacterized protein n=1 Tax=Araneus ventricosus TaxID=182803 RepID=A0A4Y1ZZA5_ARAVE|nr:hypothetical protein AVEN_115324-1 [Araneus ventricosus]
MSILLCMLWARAMDEKFKMLLLATMKAGQERMEQVQEEMKDLIQAEFMYSQPTDKPSTFDRLTSWTVFKTQFNIVSSTNGWTDFVKASQLVTSLQGSAAVVLQGIPADKLTDLTTIEKAL